MIKVVNSNEFKSEIKKDMVLVDFFAEWCGPCKILSPILDELQVEFKDKINIIKVNVDNNMDIAQQYNISNIPALVVLKKGEEVQRLMGFKSEIKKDMVLVDFFAEWCGPCKILSPILDELQVEFKDKINIIKVNVDNNMDIAQQYNISNIPALVVLKKGEEVQRLMGFSPKQVIKENIEKHL